LCWDINEITLHLFFTRITAQI